jgi:galactokinase
VSEPGGLVARAATRFSKRFGGVPTWGAAAPGRVNLIGEHTDYNRGYVLPMAIDRWCVCVAAPAAGRRSLVCALDIDETIELSLADARERGCAVGGELTDWARYLVGAIVEHADGLGVEEIPELDMLATSTVSVGGGLSSSAAIETAAAVLLEAATGVESDPLARALDCQRAEHHWAGVPCGLMDQLASSCGVAGHSLLIDCRDNTLTPVPMPDPSDAVVLVINSGVRHELAAGEYAQRRAVCDAAARGLGARSLREVEALDAVEWRLLEGEQTRCVRHVVSENARTSAAADALGAGDLSALGRLMLESHASLCDDYRVSCAELDAIVELVSANEGVWGCRMTGGGFGGCVVVLATPSAAAHLARTLPAAYLGRTGIACSVERVHAVDGARLFTL